MEQSIHSHQILKKYLALKKQKNPLFSMRALAKKLEMSPAYTSRILNGQKPIPDARLDEIIKALEIDDTGSQQLKHCLLIEQSLNKGMRDTLNSYIGIKSTVPLDKPLSSTNYAEQPVKQQTILEEWYYLPMLDLISCHNFQADPDWIADQLGLKVSVASTAWNRLVNLGCVSNENGKWLKKEGNIRFPTNKSLPSVRRFHQSFLKKAHQELATKTEQNDFDRRMIKSGCIATNAKNLPRAKEILDKAMFDVIALLGEESPSCPTNEIYSIGIQLFPLTKSTR